MYLSIYINTWPEARLTFCMHPELQNAFQKGMFSMEKNVLTSFLFDLNEKGYCTNLYLFQSCLWSVSSLWY